MPRTKRKHGQEQLDNISSDKTRPRPSPSVEARVDPTYGQRSAIPGLDDTLRAEFDEGSSDYEVNIDALNYLKAVRQEATGIPNLLVAPKPDHDNRDIYDNGVGDYRGLYGDGAYYAAPDTEDYTDEDDGSQTANQNLTYFDSILGRYEALRTQLQQIPPVQALQTLDEDHPTYVGALNTSAARWWRWKMRTVDPLPAQVSSMNKSTVLRLLGLLTGGNLLRRGAEVEVGVSRWTWSLLAKLPDRGELTSEEIGVVRELGKNAVLLGMGLKDDAALNEGMNEVEANLDDEQEDAEVMDIVSEKGIPGDLDGNVDANDGSSVFPPSQATEDPLVVANQHTDGQVSSAITAVPQKPVSEAEVIVSVSIVSKESGILEGNNLDSPPDPSQAAEDLGAAKARILRGLNASDTEESLLDGNGEESVIGKSYKWNTRATVDMILTIAGEVYGQRDLLEFRGPWD